MGNEGISRHFGTAAAGEVNVALTTTALGQVHKSQKVCHSKKEKGGG